MKKTRITKNARMLPTLSVALALAVPTVQGEQHAPDAVAVARTPAPAVELPPNSPAEAEMPKDYAQRLAEWEQRLADRERQLAERQATWARWRSLPPEARWRQMRQAELEARYADLRRRAAEIGMTLPENPPWEPVANEAAQTPQAAEPAENSEQTPPRAEMMPPFNEREACRHAHRRFMPPPPGTPFEGRGYDGSDMDYGYGPRPGYGWGPGRDMPQQPPWQD